MDFLSITLALTTDITYRSTPLKVLLSGEDGGGDCE